MKIGLFDSGVGGLTVLKTLKQIFPHNEYVYYGDTLNLPYGTKSKEELLYFACRNVEFLISKGVQIIIIACGTVSSNCHEELIKKYSVPLINIIDPTIEILKKSSCQRIGIFGTNATVNSNIFKDKLAEKEVVQVACEKFVPFIESNSTESEEFRNIIHFYVSRLGNVDTIVLACTHYPVIQSLIAKEAKGVKLIDMSKAIIKCINENCGSGDVTLYFSRLDESIKANAKKILGFEFNIQSL